MIFNLESYYKKLLFIPLGGANEIGMNVSLYHFRGEWIMVDCGSGFADAALPGVEIIVPDLSFIKAYRKSLLGIILTHIHEDHIGAIPYLWNELRCPIFTTRFTKLFLSSKIKDHHCVDSIQILEVDPKKRLSLGPFSIEMIHLTHSAPEMHALMIRTDAGNIIHTGDWKFDSNPVIGSFSDAKALKECGDEGVLALVCDSTNVFNEGTSGSEGVVKDSLMKIINSCSDMVVVTTFASNLARLDTVIRSGQQAGRQVVLTGKSLHRVFNVAQACGYLNDINDLLDEKEIPSLKRKNLLVIATGCQGEAMAAVSKMANGSHRIVRLLSGDTVIFSSKIIPDNHNKIMKICNMFVKKGIRVITERDYNVHVSGHPSVEELKLMYQLIRPNVCIPVHGEPLHIAKHVKLAQSNGIKYTVKVENGSVVLLKRNQTNIVNKVKSGYLAVDNGHLLTVNSDVLKTRTIMSKSGMIVVSVILYDKFVVLNTPILSTAGLFDPVGDKGIIMELKQDIIGSVESVLLKRKQGVILDKQSISIFIKKLLKNKIRRVRGKSPLIIVNILELR
jgi:ribonuclease J